MTQNLRPTVPGVPVHRNLFAASLLGTAALLAPLTGWADQHTAGVPALSSNPGAAYTIYLDPAGFNYSGTWYPESGTTYTPGNTPAVNDVAATGTFSAADVGQIKTMWARLAESYSGFNVNVTTVDPAAAAGQSATDAMRQAYYDATPNIMHTVVGSQIRPAGSPGNTPNNKWFSDAADGVSPGIGIVAGRAATGSGDHTNWMFSEDQAGAATGGVINGSYIGAISAHENGHSFGLYHQGDFVGASNVPVNEYSNGDVTMGPKAPGSYVPIIGNADGNQRIAWRTGDTHPNNVQTVQNDVGLILSTNTTAMATAAGRTGGVDLHLRNDGIGHSLATSTTLSLTGTNVNFNLAKGVIVPNTEANPVALGTGKYTSDYFKFTLASSSTISLTVHDDSEFLTPGVGDGVSMLRSTLTLLNSAGGVIAMGIEDASTLFETYSGLLGAGQYYFAVDSFGGHQENNPGFNAATYFDMGSYFLTGSGFTVVPEPGTVAFLVVGFGGAIMVAARRRRRAV